MRPDRPTLKPRSDVDDGRENASEVRSLMGLSYAKKAENYSTAADETPKERS